jgi:hypothetical protein
MTTLQERLRQGPSGDDLIQLGGVWHDARCLEAADAIDELVAALAKTLVSKPHMDASDGPCCSEQLPCGTWVSSGCDCGNYDDAENAQSWRDTLNAWQEQEPLRDLLTKYKEPSQ